MPYWTTPTQFVSSINNCNPYFSSAKFHKQRMFQIDLHENKVLD